jgi:plastocyanin
MKNALALSMLATLAFALSACGPSQPAGGNTVPDQTPVETNTAPAGVKKTIMLYNYKFNPNTLSVPAGSTIVFKNKDPEQHNVNIAALNIDRMLNSNESFEVSFPNPGTYEVINRLANTPMKFTLNVQ